MSDMGVMGTVVVVRVGEGEGGAGADLDFKLTSNANHDFCGFWGRFFVPTPLIITYPLKPT